MAVTAAENPSRRGLGAWLRRQCGDAPFYPLAALAGLNLFDELDQAAFGLFGPEIVRDFGVSPGVFGLIFIPMIILGMVMPVVVGHLTDRYNRVTLAVLGGTVWFVFAFATGLVTAFWMLVLVRTFTVVGRGFAGPTHSSLLVDYYPVSGRGFAFSIQQNANPIGHFIGMLAGGALATVIGWQNVFLLLPLPGIVFLLLVLRLKEPPRGQQELTASAQARVKPVGFWASIRMLLRIKSWVRFACVWLFLGAGVALSSVLPFYFAAVFGVDTFGRGLIMAATMAAQVVGTVVAGVVSQRWMARGLYQRTGHFLTLSCLASAVALAGMAVAPTLTVAVVIVIVTMPLRAMAGVPVAQIFAATLPAQIRGQGFGAIWVMFALGASFIPVALALGDATSFRVSVLAAGVPMLIAAVVALLAAKHIAGDVEQARKANGADLEPHRREPHVGKLNPLGAED